VPGLLPDSTYTATVSLAAGTKIGNLKTKLNGVSNVVKFGTTSNPAAYYPTTLDDSAPPALTAADPADGSTDFFPGTFSVNQLGTQTPLFPAGPTQFELTFDRSVLPTEANIVGSDLDGDLGAAVPLESGLTQLLVEGLSAGNHLLTLEAIDSEGLRGSALGILTVNGPPTAPQVTIAPADPSPGEGLVASVDLEASDPNRPSSALTLHWRWSRDGVLVVDLTTPSVGPGVTLALERWSVSVRAFDGEVFGPEAVASVDIGPDLN